MTEITFTGSRVPFDVQRHTVALLLANRRAYVLSTMGVGKTACPLWAFHNLKRLGLANRMLVVAPLSTLNFTWMRETTEIELPLDAVVLHGTKEKRQKLLDQQHDIYIINHDGVATIYDDLTARTDIDVLCLDELAVYRNNTARTKLMVNLARHKRFVWGMTGSPAPQAPTDVYNQAKIITPNTVPKYFGRFREETMYKVSQFKWVPRRAGIDKAFAALQPSVRYTLDDIHELPPYVSRRIDVEMGSKQQLVYEAIRKDCFTLIGTDAISAANKGVLLNKLLQISLGYVYTEKKGIVTLDNDKRIDALLDILNGGVGQALVFAAFKHALGGIHAAVKGANWLVDDPVSGDTPLAERSRIFKDFQDGKTKAIIAHPQCLAHGITLTAADTVIWFGPIASLEIYEQANARIRRTGQTKKQQFLHMQATNAERKLYQMLIEKQTIQQSLLSLFEKG